MLIMVLLQKGNGYLIINNIKNFSFFLRNNLAAIAFPETVTTDLLTILIVVKDGSSIERFENLRGKSACFPEYGGIGNYFQKLKANH